MKNWIQVLAILLFLGSPALSRTVLQNDSVADGEGIVFYPNMRGGESFVSIFDVPADYADFQICRVLLWIGPAGSNIFTVRIGEANDEGDEVDLVWQSDLDAYQVFGSQQQLSSIDLAGQRIRSQAERLRVRIRHVEGQDAPPGIATDVDGITPERNVITALMRNGNLFRGFTELLDEGGTPPRPPGDWIVRVEIVQANEACPDEVAPLPDAGMPPPVRDAGIPMDQDANTPLIDAGVAQDAAPVADMAPPQADQRVARDSEPLSALELTRISPESGSSDRNTEVVLTGRGFPVAGELFAEIGTNGRTSIQRLLELEVLSGSTATGIVPAGLDPDVYDIRVTRGDGQIAILPSGFTVVGDGLAVFSVEPNRFAADTPVELTIRGQGFSDDTTFSVAGDRLYNVVLDGETSARGTLNTIAPAGTYDLVARAGENTARLERGVEITFNENIGYTPGQSAPSDGGCRLLFHPTNGWAFGVFITFMAVLSRRRKR